MSVHDRFLPYGPAYDNVVYFFNKDDGYSNTSYYFRQNFVFGCQYYRRIWVRCSWLSRLLYNYTLWSIKRNSELLSITVANLHRLHPQYAGMRIFINNTLARVLWMYRVCCIFIRETQRQYAFCRTFYLLSLFACLCTGKDSAQVPPIGVRSLRDCRSIIQTEILPIWWRYL